MRTRAHRAGGEQGRDTRMTTRATGAVAPISHEGLNAHQHRELRNMGLLANPVACDADTVHEMENLLEYTLTAMTEHRSDGSQEHSVEILLEYALATSNPVSDNSSDKKNNSFSENVQGGDGITAFSQTERGVRQEMASLEKHEVFDLVSSASVP